MDNCDPLKRIECDWCGEEFCAVDAKRLDGLVYCSRACIEEHRAEHTREMDMVAYATRLCLRPQF